MSVTISGQGWRCALPAVCLLVLLLTPSCSSVDTKIAYQPKPPPPVCETPVIPGAPYDAVDLNCPLSHSRDLKIVVLKKDRKLLLIKDRTLIRDYYIGLGPSPSGDKVMRGDGRTPEGRYTICAKNPASAYYKSLGLNYPRPDQAEQALVQGRITREEYQKISSAAQTGTLPPPGTALGGAIFIHGGGSHEDWTLGCVAVSNYVMDELFQIIPVGTPVEVLP